MLIRHKRETIARCLNGFGILSLLERFASRPGLVVLCYHRIGDLVSDSYYTPLVSASPTAFRHQIAALRNRYRVLRLEEAIDLIDHSLNGLRGPSLLITFDDGYRDNLEVALPILRELNTPAAFFLTTSFLDGQLPWWDRIAYVIKHTKVTHLRLEQPEVIKLDLSHNRSEALVRVIAAFWQSPRSNAPEALRELEERAECVLPAGEEPPLMLNWEGARELVSHGPDYAVGSHTVTHARLSSLPRVEQERELCESKARLEAGLDQRVDALAYPYGLPGDLDGQTLDLASLAGYRAGFTLSPGLNRPGSVQPLSIKRLAVGPGDSAQMVRARCGLTLSLGRSFV
jgi:peptidoglycan/xylan/chitin deacetylase (PgdA/CDA1 family)